MRVFGARLLRPFNLLSGSGGPSLGPLSLRSASFAVGTDMGEKGLVVGHGLIGGTYVAPNRRRSSPHQRRFRVRLWRSVRLRGKVHDLASSPTDVQAAARLTVDLAAADESTQHRKTPKIKSLFTDGAIACFPGGCERGVAQCTSTFGSFWRGLFRR